MFKFGNKPKKAVDYTSGPLFMPYLRFALALLVSNLAQSLYNTADRIIIGRYSGDPNALASMSATGTLSIMLINTITALSVGATITLARAHGKKDNEEISGFLHTALTFAFLAGLVSGIVGQFVSMPLLDFLGTKPELIDNAAAYIRIIFMGLPFASLFAFSDIALRARGQGAKSSAVIVMAGIINVALNILFVSVFNMTVRGVAIATVMSQAFSAAASLILLYRDEESIAFRIKRIHINPKRLGEIVKIGVPSSVNAIVTSLASMVTVSAFNSLPLDVIRADAAAGSAVTIFNLTVSSFTWSAITVVVAQNVGARNYKRIRSTMVYASAVISVIALIFIPVYLIFSKTVISLFYDSSLAGFETIVSLARPIFIPLCINVVFAGFSTVMASTSRAIGHPVTPLVISFVALSFNVSWCLFVFPHYGTPIMYYLYIPISVTLELIIHVITNSIYRARLKKEFSKDPVPTATTA